MYKSVEWLLSLTAMVGAVACSGEAGPSSSTMPVARAVPARAVEESHPGSSHATAAAAVTTTSAAPIDSTASSAVACVAPAAGEPHELVVWHAFGGAAKATLEGQVAEFNALGTGTTVTLMEPENYWELLNAFNAVPEDQLPDVMFANEDSIGALVVSELTIAPDVCNSGAIPFDDLLPVAEATFTVGGRLVAVPYAVSTPVLYFDADAFRQAGLDPGDPPDTLAELREASDRVVASGAAPHGLVAYDQYGGWLLRQGAAKRGDVLLEPGNGRGDVEDVDARFVTAENVDALRWLAEGVTSGSFLWIGGNPSGQDDFHRLVADRDGAAMTLHTSASLGEVLQVVESGALGERELGVGPMPGPAPGGLVGGSALWLIDHGSEPAQLGAAWTFVEWLMDPSRLAELDAATGYVPPRDAVLEEPSLQQAWAEHPQLRVAYDQLAVMTDDPTAAGMLSPALVSLLPLTNEAATRVVEGQDPATVLADIEEQFQAMIELQPLGR